MALIGAPIALHDIANCEAFVQRTIDRSQIRYSPQEREELLAEGLTILFELAGKYKPLQARPGIDKQPGRFSGYAAMFLPRRLGDAWHRWHPEHRYLTDPQTGERGWCYGQPMLSLDAVTDPARAGAGERALLHARGVNGFCHATVGVSGRAATRAAG